MNVLIVGTGYVGLVTGVCFAGLGHQVLCVDVDKDKVSRLQRGEVPMHEPGLADRLTAALTTGRLTFAAEIPKAKATEVALITVGTPSLPDGDVDLRAVWSVVEELAVKLPERAVLGTKSTVPVGTGQAIRRRLDALGRHDLSVVSVPEFLREGSAITDMLHPYRLVFGVTDAHGEAALRALHQGLNAPVLVTDTATAEMMKYASNAFLATKISFINEIANICARTGADVSQVALGMGLDPRIGPAFLRAGLGYGGSCFPKDTRALVHIAGAANHSFQLLKAVVEVNQRQRLQPIKQLRAWFGSLKGLTVVLLGVAFKPGTDDTRESPANDLTMLLQAEGANVRLVDPVVRQVPCLDGGMVPVLADAYSVLTGADAAILVTEWPEFLELDWKKVAALMRRPFVFDGRNVLPSGELQAAGITFANVGGRVEEAARWMS
ncbi:MAG: UDP-glucose/GDP-mannose dehydrogenase family protein [Alicyclobacillus herbarius]|uniref:UDP-glucose dehydrogenase family protein n=1 Tax=Alicyclobacillus herbarius TaxID=122960 RepID=UPI002353D115|nr:UDP-glucose/GDP-mannose dehydrogenase family protein [Alicyclobacillus herbarius]MCL6634048.1 UDP-glucose/GDP-mannose dehydrogenase family protein [Alicyclobacillus herbarius]